MSSGSPENQAAFQDAELLAEAQSNSGLDDFGPDEFRPALEKLTFSLREEAPVNELGRTILRARLVESLAERRSVIVAFAKVGGLADALDEGTGALAAFGTAPVPSASLFMLAAVLSAVGVAPEQTALVVGFVLPFDRLLDMTRTVPSASANLTVATTVARWEGDLDEAVYRAPDTA